MLAAAAVMGATSCGGKEDTEENYLTSIESVKEHIKGEWYSAGGYAPFPENPEFPSRDEFIQQAIEAHDGNKKPITFRDSVYIVHGTYTDGCTDSSVTTVIPSNTPLLKKRGNFMPTSPL
jgi:hypothetical protein